MKFLVKRESVVLLDLVPIIPSFRLGVIDPSNRPQGLASDTKLYLGALRAVKNREHTSTQLRKNALFRKGIYVHFRTPLICRGRFPKCLYHKDTDGLQEIFSKVP